MCAAGPTNFVFSLVRVSGWGCGGSRGTPVAGCWRCWLYCTCVPGVGGVLSVQLGHSGPQPRQAVPLGPPQVTQPRPGPQITQHSHTATSNVTLADILAYSIKNKVDIFNSVFLSYEET